MTNKKFFRSMAVLVLLIVGLTITTMALMRETLQLNDHTFETGRMKINLNNGQKLKFRDVNGNDIAYFEPGMTVVSDFFVRNEGTNDMYYRFYFDQVEGELAEVVHVTILDGNEIIFEGDMRNMDRKHSSAVDDVLAINESKTLTIMFTVDQNSGNQYMSKYLAFALNAEGTQVRNNPNREFNK